MSDMPIFDRLKRHATNKAISFHMPGHKYGNIIPSEFINDLIRLDITEIPGFDNLHSPEGIILDAQNLAAKAFNADKTFFLVNGSTCGIHAMIYTVCNRGDKLIVGRDCHKSVISGMSLAGVDPIFVNPEYNELFGISTDILPSKIEEVLIREHDVKGVFITCPSYYGICSDIKSIAQIAHRYNKVLLVDEAHGAHLKFSKRLPKCALDSGADLCVQSAHKTLPAFTQTSYLHIKSRHIDEEKLKYFLSVLQSSSPSYILMASLDIARHIMQSRGQKLLNALIDNVNMFKTSLSKSYKIFDSSYLKSGDFDATRLTINSKDIGISGYDLENLLRLKYNIQTEMADFNNIVCLTSVANSANDFNLLLNSLNSIADQRKRQMIIPRRYDKINILLNCMKTPESVYKMSDAMNKRNIFIRIDQAHGRVSKGLLVPYPPGIPLVCPGELLSEDVICYIKEIISLGGKIEGVIDNLYISVID